MQSEVRVRFTILTIRSVPDAICKNRLQAVKIIAHNIEFFVDNNSRQILAHPLPHEACLAVMNVEPLFQKNGSSLRCKALNTALESFVSRERQVVSIT